MSYGWKALQHQSNPCLSTFLVYSVRNYESSFYIYFVSWNIIRDKLLNLYFSVDKAKQMPMLVHMAIITCVDIRPINTWSVTTELTIIKIDDTHKTGVIVTNIAPGVMVHVMWTGKNLFFCQKLQLSIFRSIRQNSTEKGDSLSSGGSSSPVSLEHQKSDEALSIHSEKEITDDITARTSELTIQQ